jgi:hypothetical protein
MKKIIICILFFMVSLSLFAEEKYDWLINYTWRLETDLFDLYEPIRVMFRKFEIIPYSIMYQERLRRERFTLVYQTGIKGKLFQLEDMLSNNVYDLELSDNFTSLSIIWGKMPFPMRQKRVGQLVNNSYPLVGVWGSLPYLTEYRIVDPTGCLIYMDIESQYPHLAVREGTYLLKQINENTFETVSSFPDGRLRLTVLNEKEITLLPLFTVPDDEEEFVIPMLICR